MKILPFFIAFDYIYYYIIYFKQLKLTVRNRIESHSKEQLTYNSSKILRKLENQSKTKHRTYILLFLGRPGCNCRDREDLKQRFEHSQVYTESDGQN